MCIRDRYQRRVHGNCFSFIYCSQMEKKQTIMCVECNQFYGNPDANNMCSTCYNNHKKLQIEHVPDLNNIPKEPNIQQVSVPQKKEQTQRCWKCNVRVGFLGFQCKCMHSFCTKHRHFDDHQCTFDFKSEGKNKILLANPVLEIHKLNYLQTGLNL
eukprot:TRINITY_DN6574_c0_g1_i1.p2 TRINITY_DN6574_c0_g1~~TRINITY_DN6574_c0_g1_i1.p2  ORF type:complete len:156 (+),score=23.36 TRINITY_DN6574_c0_g1_i1:64-531(+)